MSALAPVLDREAVIPTPAEARLGIETVLRAVAEVDGVTVADLKGAARVKRLVRSRHRAILLLRRLRPDLSRAMIGIQLGGRDHQTVRHGEAAAFARLNSDPDDRDLTQRALAALGRRELPSALVDGWGLLAARRRVLSLELQLADARARLAKWERPS